MTTAASATTLSREHDDRKQLRRAVIASTIVGPDGAVVGVEREARFAEMARAELSRRGLRNVEVVNADALNTGLQKAAYDFVHERLVLINLPANSQRALLTEMFSLLKPGGTIALQEFDAVSNMCFPEHASWQRLATLWNEVFQAAGGNEFVGRSLGHLLRALGAENIQMKVHVEVAQIGQYRRTHLLSLIESMRETILASARITETELHDHMVALSAHLADPGTTLIDKLIVQAWGHRPA